MTLALDLPVITPIDQPALRQALQHKIDHLTKPLGALGQLEALAMQLALIQGTTDRRVALDQPQMLVFAADHGLVAEGISAYPQAVTQQMVLNMLGGGAAVNVLARQHGFALTVVDAGVAAGFDVPHDSASAAGVRFLQHKVAPATGNALHGDAMTPAQARQALETGMAIVRKLPGRVLALGEMGIGNTSSASLVYALLHGVPVSEITGRGTGLDDAGLTHKQTVLQQVAARHAQVRNPLQVLCAVGGFEIAMMAGAMLQAASERRVLLIDGFIAGAAALLARALQPACSDYMVLCHRSHEAGHQRMLQVLLDRPAFFPRSALLDLGLRLGEGSGALLAWPLVQSAVVLLEQMASFESAGVSQSDR